MKSKRSYFLKLQYIPIQVQPDFEYIHKEILKPVMAKRKERKVFDNEFRNNTVHYALEHKELKTGEAAMNLGVGKSTLNKWISEFKQSSDCDMKIRGTGNYDIEQDQQYYVYSFHKNLAIAS